MTLSPYKLNRSFLMDECWAGLVSGELSILAFASIVYLINDDNKLDIPKEEYRSRAIGDDIVRKKQLMTVAIIGIMLFATLVTFVKAEEPPQNDAGSGKDAGNTPADAIFITPGCYNGTLFNSTTPKDLVDHYNFTAYEEHHINVTMTHPPIPVDFRLELLDPYGNPVAHSDDPERRVEEVEYDADLYGNWTIRISSNYGEGNYTFCLAPVNYPPEIPEAPSGNSSGYVYTSYTYNASTTDIEGDSITYEFNWNDSTPNTTVGPHASGAITSASHQWIYPTTYNVTVRAKDAYDFWSGWSDIKTVTLSQNDADNGGDAGNTAASALPILQGTYNGTLYYPDPVDTVDFYNFTVTVEDWIHVTMTPPTSTDFQLELHDPDGNLYGSYKPGGQTENIDQQAYIAGNWSIRVSRYTGEGQYVFTLSITSGQAQLTISVPQAPPGGVNITIDDVNYKAYASTPVSVTLAIGQHTIEAEQGFIKEEWKPGTYYIYRFDHWSDGETDNPRNINLTQDTSLTAYYLRSKYGIL